MEYEKNTKHINTNESMHSEMGHQRTERKEEKSMS